jgi:hypothetical protein
VRTDAALSKTTTVAIVDCTPAPLLLGAPTLADYWPSA